ncbi:MAG: fibronectin type III domain-containing protein, partial [Gemmatimonadaceae bacterium]
VRLTTMLVNSPGRLLSDCGAAPAPPSNPVDVTQANNNGALWEVKLSWSPSNDDKKTSGAGDVRGYALEWSTDGGTSWSALTTTPARRQTKYYWFHGLPVVGTSQSVTAEYRVRAIDCGGLFSSAVPIGSVTY